MKQGDFFTKPYDGVDGPSEFLMRKGDEEPVGKWKKRHRLAEHVLDRVCEKVYAACGGDVEAAREQLARVYTLLELPFAEQALARVVADVILRGRQV